MEFAEEQLLPMQASVGAESLVSVLGVVYSHRKTSDGGDMYLTRFGIQYANLLELDNWYEPSWFEARRERLEGTSAVYRVPTKPRRGRNLDLVVKNCRVGENVPLETRTLLEFINTEFNSPWEEFALVMELREGKFGPPDIRCQLPNRWPSMCRRNGCSYGRAAGRTKKSIASGPAIPGSISIYCVNISSFTDGFTARISSSFFSRPASARTPSRNCSARSPKRQ